MVDSTEGKITPVEYTPGFIERIKVSTLLGRPNTELSTSPAFKAAIPEINRVFSDTGVWHGTGAYQYRPGDRSEIRDVLQTIIAEDGLIPHTDVLDFTQGEMESVSGSPAWLYALMYAQWHYERGNSFFDYARNGLISAYYLAPMAWRGLVEAFVHRNPDYLKMLDRETRQEFTTSAASFHDKYSKTRSSKLDMPRGGQSDIAGNYPILIGIKNGGFKPRPIARLLEKHEVRSSTPIHMEDFTHIEVPNNKVAVVRAALQVGGKSVPVYSIESCIEYARHLPLKTVLDGKTRVT